MKQAELARRAGMPNSRLSDLERERYKEPKRATIEKIAAVLNRPVYEFYGEKPPIQEGQQKSEARTPTESYTERSDSAIPRGTSSHDEQDLVAVLRAALSSNNLPADFKELAGTIVDAVRKLADVRVLLEGLGTAFDSARIPGHGAEGSRGIQDSGGAHEAFDGDVLRHPPGRQAG